MEDKKQNLLSRIISEYRKVTWASLPEVIQVTIVVLIITTFVALMIMLFDFSFKTIIDAISNTLAKFIK
ncbi:preprotein translocase subunit SecE [Caviibacter abscessus]|uniref:preprotein translocase subunit SecE n=1 Tax=Caviibacter abscessus TaxID=1766719 RepID=UPI00082AF105|nr:preprotein translocase subunit SecE [Caviibacter abscessus]